MSARQFDGNSVGFACFKGETSATCSNGEQLYSLLLFAILVIFGPASATAQSSGDGSCTALAPKIMPNTPRHGVPGATFSISEQRIRAERYSECLQLQSTGVIASVYAAGKGGTFITFDIPVAPVPTAINPASVVTGHYFDAGNLIHSFLRMRNGKISIFDPRAPHAATSPPMRVRPLSLR